MNRCRSCGRETFTVLMENGVRIEPCCPWCASMLPVYTVETFREAVAADLIAKRLMENLCNRPALEIPEWAYRHVRQDWSSLRPRFDFAPLT